MFLRNVGWLSTDYTAYIPEDKILHNHRRENLKSCMIWNGLSLTVGILMHVCNNLVLYIYYSTYCLQKKVVYSSGSKERKALSCPTVRTYLQSANRFFHGRRQLSMKSVWNETLTLMGSILRIFLSSFQHSTESIKVICPLLIVIPRLWGLRARLWMIVHGESRKSGNGTFKHILLAICGKTKRTQISMVSSGIRIKRRLHETRYNFGKYTLTWSCMKVYRTSTEFPFLCRCTVYC
jgi:hypothetical protein